MWPDGEASATKAVNFAARVLSGRRKHQSIADVICHVRWLTAEQLIQYHRIMSVYRLVTHRVPAALAGTIGPPASRLHQHDTRDADMHTVMMPTYIVAAEYTFGGGAESAVL